MTAFGVHNVYENLHLTANGPLMEVEMCRRLSCFICAI